VKGSAHYHKGSGPLPTVNWGFFSPGVRLKMPRRPVADKEPDGDEMFDPLDGRANGQPLGPL